MTKNTAFKNRKVILVILKINNPDIFKRYIRFLVKFAFH